MVVAEIGERAGSESQTVQAALIQPVTGRFQCQMADAIVRKDATWRAMATGSGVVRPPE